MVTVRELVVNADDFGRSEAINRGIARAYDEGIVTSASLMVRHAAAAEAAALAQARPDLGLGLHVDLGEWAVVDDDWQALYEVVPVDDAAAVEAEIGDQLDAFRRLVGEEPTHLDSHQHVHRYEPVRTVLAAQARELAVPLRHVTPGVEYRGDYYGRDESGAPIPGALDAGRLVELIQAVPAGVTEIGCHPGEYDAADRAYGRERVLELEALCDPRVRGAIEAAGVRLCSFRRCNLSRPA